MKVSFLPAMTLTHNCLLENSQYSFFLFSWLWVMYQYWLSTSWLPCAPNYTWHYNHTLPVGVLVSANDHALIIILSSKDRLSYWWRHHFVSAIMYPPCHVCIMNVIRLFSFLTYLCHTATSCCFLILILFPQCSGCVMQGEASIFRHTRKIQTSLPINSICSSDK